MDCFQTRILAVAQAITAFLSISCSTHPILVPAPTGWEDQGLAFDPALHGGTPLRIPAWKAIGRRASPA